MMISVCVAGLLAVGCDSSLEAYLALDSSEPACVVPANSAEIAEAVLSLANYERELRGMNPLVLNNALSEYSAEYACTMIADGFFDHDNPLTGEEFADRHQDSPFRCYPVGENLALGQDSAISVFEDWMNSELHRKNMLDDGFREMGLGVRRNSADQRLYWVQMFLGRAVESGVAGCDADSFSVPGGLIDALGDVPPLPGQTDVPLSQPVSSTPGSADPSADE